MTHASAAGSLLEVPADLVRLSVGLEDADDLVDDVRQALDSLGLTAQPRASPYTRSTVMVMSTRRSATMVAR